MKITPGIVVADYSKKSIDESDLTKRAEEALFKTRAYGKYRLCLHGGDLFRKIIAVPDCYDAMTSGRTYRKDLSKEVVIKEMKRVAGIQLALEIVEVFAKMLKQ